VARFARNDWGGGGVTAQPRLRIGAILALSLCWTESAFAEPLTPSDETRSTLRRVMTCVVSSDLFNRNGRGIFPFLANSQNVHSIDYIRFRVSFQNCLDNENHDGRYVELLHMWGPQIRGQIFRSLFLKADQGKLLQAINDNTKSFMPMPPDYQSQSTRIFGSCVARLDSVNSRAILNNPVASPAENAAYEALKPTFSQCITPGNTIRFSKQVIEGAVAEGLVVNMFDSASRTAGQGAK
jgi:hypothetical protein